MEQQISDNWDLKSQPKAQFPTFIFLRKAVTSCCGATLATPSPSACRAVKCYGLAIFLLITQKSWVASEQTLLRESIQWAISAAAFLLNPLCHDSWLWLFFLPSKAGRKELHTDTGSLTWLSCVSAPRHQTGSVPLFLLCASEDKNRVSEIKNKKRMWLCSSSLVSLRTLSSHGLPVYHIGAHCFCDKLAD